MTLRTSLMGLLAFSPLLAVAACGESTTPGNAQPDTTDANGDGVPDSLGTTFDANGDGIPDQVDANGDGILDGVGVDTDGDGIADAVGIDIDGDGIVDGLDTDGDGMIDVEPPPVMQPTGDGDGGGMTPVGDGDGDGDGGGTQNPSNACGWEGTYSGPDLAGCEGKTTAGGGFFTFDHFDDLNEGIVASRDGRTGNWWSVAHESITANLTFAAPPAGGPVNSVGAAHYTATAGSADAWTATMGVEVSECYDARAYEGLSFWFKGDPNAGQSTVKLSLHTPPTQPAENGGACTGDCYDHYAVLLEATGQWKKYDLPWSAFERIDCIDPTPAIPANFQPQAQLLTISFSQVDVTKGLDFWVDDVQFLRSGLSATSTFQDIVPESVFDEMFPPGGRDPVFTYAGLLEAVNNCTSGAWPACSSFTTEGTLEDRMLEAAAFLAQVAHETGSLSLVKEEACSKAVPEGPCPYNPYYGRGAIQLSWKTNYDAAGAAFGVDISTNPDLVATDPKLAWGTALWFWSTDQSSKGVCHNEIVHNKNFGGTTNIINGMDCGGERDTARQFLFQTFAYALGVNPHTSKLGC